MKEAKSIGIWPIWGFKMPFLGEVLLKLKSEEWVGYETIWNREHRGLLMKTYFDWIVYL